MPLARPPCLTSAYHSLFQKEAPLLEPSRSTGAASHVTQSMHIGKWIEVQWSSLQNKLKKYNFGLHQILKLWTKFLQRRSPHLEPCLLHSCSMKLFRHHFLRIVCGRPFYGFRASRKCWRLVEPESGQTKRRRRPSSGTAAPTPPLPQITLLQSSLQFKQIHFPNTVCIWTNTFCNLVSPRPFENWNPNVWWDWT